jgi:hypothetical protein
MKECRGIVPSEPCAVNQAAKRERDWTVLFLDHKTSVNFTVELDLELLWFSSIFSEASARRRLKLNLDALNLCERGRSQTSSQTATILTVQRWLVFFLLRYNENR